MPAGRLKGRFSFLSVPYIDGEGGIRRGAPVTEFTADGELIPRFGGESVIAARLQSTQPYTLRVRQTTLTRAVTTDWQVKDARSGALYNIRTIADPDQKGAWFDMLVESGVAA